MYIFRHREVGFSPVRLARYTLALNALCMDPRQFYGHDLVGTLQHHEEPPTDYEFALTTLAVCSAQAHGRKRQIRRLLDIASSPQDHNLGTYLNFFDYTNIYIALKRALIISWPRNE